MRRRLRVPTFLIALSATSMVGTVARAQGNYHSQPLGGRSALMGGTGVALGADGAAPLLNPAGIVNVRGGSLAFASRLFQYRDRTYDAWHQPLPIDANRFGALDLGDVSESNQTLDSLPTTTCYFADFGQGDSGERLHQFAFCIAKTEESDVSISAARRSAAYAGGRVDLAESSETSWGRRHFGLGWGIEVGEHVKLGTSLYASLAKYSLFAGGHSLFESGGRATTGGYQFSATAASWELVPSVGVIVKISDELTAGASVRGRTLRLSGDYEATLAVNSHDGTVMQEVTEGDFLARLPPRIAMGIGWQSGRWRVEGDGFFHFGEEDYARIDVTDEQALVASNGSVSRLTRTRDASDFAVPVANWGLGVEMFIDDELSVLAGGNTDFSALPDLDATAGPLNGRHNSYHGALGIGSYGSLGELLIGTRVSYSVGQVATVDQLAPTPTVVPTDQTEIAVALVLSGRVHLRTVGQAAIKVLDTVRRTPEGDGAKSGD
jgi:hypothetical protein